MTRPRRSDVDERVDVACASFAAARETAVSDPLDAIRHALDAREECAALIHALAPHARLWHGENGATWTEIARALACTRQAAQQRYGAAADQLLRDHVRGQRQARLTT